ncbi:MAG: class I SAM-dependent methyltransferase [bacterium]
MANTTAPSRLLRRFLATLKKRGLRRTLLGALSYGADYWFDLKHGTDTIAAVKLDDLGVDDAQKAHAQEYQSTHARPLKNLLMALSIPPGKVLLDLGCGKGKVLLLAAEFGFKEARGVDFSPALCKIAGQNCAAYKARTKTQTAFAIYAADVLAYQMRDDEDVFFLFNPFDAYILKQVLLNILASRQQRRRKIWIIYRRAVHRKIIEETIPQATVSDFTFWGFDFVVFEVESDAEPDHH